MTCAPFITLDSLETFAVRGANARNTKKVPQHQVSKLILKMDEILLHQKRHAAI